MINNAMLQLVVRLQLMKDLVTSEERERGATAVEYALLIAIIGIALAAAAAALAGKLTSTFTAIENKLV